MSIDRWVMRFAGTVVLVSLLLAHFVSLNWLWLTAFVGANLLQSSFTGFCPLGDRAEAPGRAARPRLLLKAERSSCGHPDRHVC